VPIRQFLEAEAFDPELLQQMSAALAGACRGTWRPRLFTSADESQQFFACKNWHAFHMEAARKLSRLHPTVSFVNSLALRDRLQNQSRTKEVSEPNRCSR
jgi:hypothetical protein